MPKSSSRLLDEVKAPLAGRIASRKEFMGSLAETAARAVVTATVTFAAGMILKKMFEKSVEKVATEVNEPSAKPQASKTPGGPPRYKSPAKRLPTGA